MLKVQEAYNGYVNPVQLRPGVVARIHPNGWRRHRQWLGNAYSLLTVVEMRSRPMK